MKRIFVQIRKAVDSDAALIAMLVRKYTFKKDGSGFLLSLNTDSVKRLVGSGNFFVAYAGRHLSGCASIVEYDGIAELRSLAVNAKYQSHGIGSMLIEECKKEASERGHKRLYALVNRRAYKIFQKHGFADARTPPEKLAKDCISCPLYNGKCNEKAIVASLKD